MRVNDLVLKAVAFIGAQNDRGQFVPNGTGFLARLKVGGRQYQHLITCWHVVKPLPEKIAIRVNNIDGMAVTLFGRKSRFFRHPEADKRPGQVIDVAVMPMGLKQADYDVAFIPMDVEDGSVISDEIMKDEHIGVGDDAFVVGLLVNHYGEAKNLPVVRCGTIAGFPDEPIETPEGFAQAHLIETHSIGGLSGSPAFVQMAPFRIINGAVTQSSKRTQYLLGMVQGHFKIKNPTDVVVEPGGDPNATFNTGIGVVIPVRLILETMMHPDLVAERDGDVQSHREAKGFVADGATKQPTPEPSEEGHKERFTALLGAAAKTKKQDD